MADEQTDAVTRRPMPPCASDRRQAEPEASPQPDATLLAASEFGPQGAPNSPLSLVLTARRRPSLFA